MRRLLFDTNGIDAIATLDGLYDALRVALEAGDVEVLVTHVQVDELLVMADKNTSDDQRERRGQLIAMLNGLCNVRHIPTSGFVVGLSRMGSARLDDELKDEIANGPEFARKDSNLKDVLLVNTASADGAEFISFDGQALGYARGRHVAALTPEELLASLRS